MHPRSPDPTSMEMSLTHLSTPPRIQRRSKRLKQNSLELLTLSVSKADLKEGSSLHEDTNLTPSKRSSLFQTTAFSTPSRGNHSTNRGSRQVLVLCSRQKLGCSTWNDPFPSVRTQRTRQTRVRRSNVEIAISPTIN